jgi:MFS family permease
VGLLLINSLQAEPSVWAVFVLAAIMSGFSGLRRPPLEAMTQQLVPRDLMNAAAGLNSLRGTIGMIGGPALGGVLIATAGLGWTFAFDVATFAFSLLALALMANVPVPAGAERPSFGSVLEGIRYARSRQDLIGTYVVDFIAMVFGMPIALFPAIADNLGGPGVLGLLYAAPGAGAFIASLTSGWTTRVHRHGLAILIAAMAWGAGITVFGLLATGVVREAWLALPFLAFAGGADMISGLFRLVIWNQTIPEELRGRLASIEQISYTSGPLLGNVESGLVAGIFGVPVSVISGGILCILGTGLCAWVLPQFRNFDARTTPHLLPTGTAAH